MRQQLAHGGDSRPAGRGPEAPGQRLPFESRPVCSGGIAVAAALACGALLLGCGAGDEEAPPLPNLTADRISFAANTVALGEDVAVTRRIRNTGTAAAGPFEVRYYLTVGALEILTDTEVLPGGLAAGTDDEGVFVMSSGSSTGTFGLRLVVDGARQVAESDERDNEPAGSNFLTVVASGQPDLSGSILSCNEPLPVGGTVAARVRAANSGSAASPPCAGALYISADAVLDGGDVALLASPAAIPSLAPGQAADIELSFTVPDRHGAQYLLWFVDSLSAVAELDEANNVSSRAVTLDAPDLEPTGTGVETGLPPAGRPLGEIMLTASFRETSGVAVEEQFAVAAYLSTDDATIEPGVDALVGTAAAGPLAASGSGSVELAATIPAGTPRGRYVVGCQVDAAGDVYEENESNNVDGPAGVLEFDVLAPALAPGETDLVADRVSTASGRLVSGDWSSEVVAEALFECSVELRSMGADPDTFQVGIYFSDDEVIDTGDTLVGSAAIKTSDLARGAHVTCQAPATGTSFYWGAIADYDASVSELDETNNVVLGGQIALATVPEKDIVASGAGVLAPPVLEVGQPRNVLCRLAVEGNDDTGPFAVRFYLSPDPVIDGGAGDIEIGSAAVADPGLPAGYGISARPWAGLLATVAVPGGTQAGAYYFGYIADANSEVAETDEGNNVWISTETVQVIDSGGGPDLVVLTYEPTGATPPAFPTWYAQAGSASAVWPVLVVANVGTREAAPGTQVGIYLSEDEAVSPATDHLVGTVVCDALGAGESQLFRDVALDLSGVDEGAYYLYAFADPAGALAELDETNNDSATLELGQATLGAWMAVVAGAQAPAELSGSLETEGEYESAGAGTTISLAVAITNSSLQTPAQSSAVSYWISRDTNASIGAGDVYLGSQEAEWLSPGETCRAVWAGPLGFAPELGPSYALKARFDSLDEVDEANEQDNIAVSAPFVFVAPGG